MRLLTMFFLMVGMLCSASLAKASHLTNGHDISVDKIAIIESALEALLRDKNYDVADKFVRHHLDGSINTSRFLHLAVISYRKIGADQQALALLLIAKTLYPNEALFTHELAMLHAQNYDCGKALSQWAIYEAQIGSPLAENNKSSLYRYCPDEWFLQGGIITKIERDQSAYARSSRQQVTADEGSYLSQLCTAITGLCPANNQFTVNNGRRPQTALAMGLHYKTNRLITERDKLHIDYRQNHQLTAPHQNAAYISIGWQRFNRDQQSHMIRFGINHRYEPAYHDDRARRHDAISLDISRQTKLPSRITQTLTASMMTGRNENNGFKGYGVGLSYKYNIHERLQMGMAIRGDRLNASHLDLLGSYQRQSHELSARALIHRDVILSLSAARIDTDYEKTLPYLAAPHQLVTRQKAIEFIYTGALTGHFHPYIGLSFHKSKSENELQAGKNRSLNFGLTISF